MLEKTVADRKKKADKVEHNIKNARVSFGLFHLQVRRLIQICFFLQDNWQPALEKLIASIGEKFSAAFDRKHNTFSHQN